MRYLKLILFLALLVLLFSLGRIVVVSSGSKDSTIDIAVSPSNSKIIIDGKSGKAGKNLVYAGQHNITVSKSGFFTDKRVLVTNTGEVATAGFILNSSSQSTKNWYDEHPSDARLAESITSSEYDSGAQSAINSNQLLNQLPTVFGDGQGGLINISSGVPIGNSDQPAIYVSANTAAARKSVLEWIKNRGYDTSTMDIVFYNELSNFDSGGE